MKEKRQYFLQMEKRTDHYLIISQLLNSVSYDIKNYQGPQFVELKAK
jgi:hypothetical protein